MSTAEEGHGKGAVMEVDIVRALAIPDRQGQQQKERRRSRRFKRDPGEQTGEENDTSPEDSADFLPAVEEPSAAPEASAPEKLEREDAGAPPEPPGRTGPPRHVDLVG